MEKAFAHGWQILCYGNGDAASDRFISAVRLAKKKHPDVDNRPVLIHGQVLGPKHRVPVATALKAMTIWPAWQHFEEKTKGSIEVGKLADFVILSENPLTIAEDQLADIKVLETIKEGKSTYQRL